MSVISDMGIWLGKGGTPSFLTTLLTFEYQVTKPLSADSRFWRSLGETNSPPSSSFTLQYRVTKPVSLAKDFWRPKGKIPFWGDKSQHDCKHGQVRCKSDRWYPNDYTSHMEETMQKYYFLSCFHFCCPSSMLDWIWTVMECLVVYQWCEFLLTFDVDTFTTASCKTASL